jgi:hypothetical protein
LLEKFSDCTRVCCIAIYRVLLLEKLAPMSRDKLATNSSESIVKFSQTKFYHEWYSEDYFMNKTTIQVYNYLLGININKILNNCQNI